MPQNDFVKRPTTPIELFDTFTMRMLKETGDDSISPRRSFCLANSFFFVYQYSIVQFSMEIQWKKNNERCACILENSMQPSQHDISVCASIVETILPKCTRIVYTQHEHCTNNTTQNQWSYLNLFIHNEKQLTTMKLAKHFGIDRKLQNTAQPIFYHFV